MAGSANRSLRLGDIGANAPDEWRWGVGGREPHVLLMLFAKPDRVDGVRERTTREAAERGGLDDGRRACRQADMGGVEPFGFVDGVSQPTFDWDRARTPGTKADRAYTNLARARRAAARLSQRIWLSGGDADAGGGREKTPVSCPRPRMPPAAATSAAMAPISSIASLSQDVRGFWRWAAGEAARAGVRAGGARRSGGRPPPERRAARRSRSRTCPCPGVNPQRSRRQRLSVRRRSRRPLLPGRRPYPARQSAHGRCPRGRRRPDRQSARDAGPDDAPASPKPTSSTLPWPSNTTVWPYLRSQDDAIASARFHRILRRGREYGKRIDRAAALDPATPDPKAGLQFLCLNANIARQFEFVQGAWLANSKFAGLTGEQDPLLGNREPFPIPPVSDAPQRTDGFTRPGAEPQLPSRGGSSAIRVRARRRVFFLPGLAALKWIASE